MNNKIEIQYKILEIVKYFDSFCKKNKIEYYLMGGSALGAVRHRGFIPWDDDFDVFMTFDNYSKFIEIAQEKLNKEKYYLQKENTTEWPLYFTKLRLNGTTFIEEDTQNRKMHKGFYIDIMCLNNVSNNRFLRYLQYLSARILTIKSLYIRGYKTNNMLKKISLFIINKFLTNKGSELLISYVRSFNNKNTKYVGHFFGRAKYKNSFFKSKYLGKPKYLKFSNLILPVPKNVEKYLEIRYGTNFMEMPDDKTKSLYPSHFIFADTNKDYLEYEK